MIHVDTSAFYAYLSADDQDHAAVAASFRSALEAGWRLAACSYVVCETMGLVQHRLGATVVRRFVADILPLVQVTWIGRDEHAAAWAVWSEVHKRSFTIADAASAALMRRDRVRRILTLDPEFSRLGFDRLPAPGR